MCASIAPSRSHRWLMLAGGLLATGAVLMARDASGVAQASSLPPTPTEQAGSLRYLKTLSGSPLRFQQPWLVVVFLSPECPVANASIPTLNALKEQFGSKGFDFVGVYSDPNLQWETLQHHAADYRVAFPVADDRAQQVAHGLRASYTPEAFVLSREGAVLYCGRIDDRVSDFNSSRPAATKNDLEDVLAALAKGKIGPFPNTPGFGCPIPEAVKQ